MANLETRGESSLGESLGRGEDESETFAQEGGEAGKPRFIDEADGDEIAQVDAVLVAEGGKFHAHEGCERDEAERSGVLALVDAGVGFRLVGTGLFLRKDDMHSIADLAVCAVEEDIKRPAVAGRGDAAMVEAGRCQRDGRGGNVLGRVRSDGGDAVAGGVVRVGAAVGRARGLRAGPQAALGGYL